MADPYEIDEVSSAKRRSNAYQAYYDYLFEMDGHLEEVENMDIEEIILQVCTKDREIQFGRKVAHINSRALLQDSQQDASDQKASIFRETKSLFLNTAGVVCQVAAVGFGPGFSGAAQAFSTSANYVRDVRESRQEILNHSYQRMREIVGDHTQGAHSADKEHDQDGTTIDRMIQNSRRQAELVAGGS